MKHPDWLENLKAATKNVAVGDQPTCGFQIFQPNRE